MTEMEKKRAAEELASCPPGTRKMTEEERLETLADLNQQKADLNNQLEKLPISKRTMALQQRERELIEKIQETEKAITMFSRKTVYIALD